VFFLFILDAMINNEHFWIGEVVEITSFDSILLELFNKEYNLIQNPFISIHQNNDEILYCVLQTFEDSIDKTRKAVALNMTEEEIKKEHPEHTFLIKPYIIATIIGSLHDSTFSSGIQKFNVGLHSRFEKTSTKTINWFLQNTSSLSSLLNHIIKNQFLKYQLKSICALWMQNNEISNSKPILLRSLSYLLRDDYFLLKEIADYIKQN
jgi:hypothetical protein